MIVVNAKAAARIERQAAMRRPGVAWPAGAGAP
jgi:hypothetical protein